ncbi:MAG TPA: hypothetical protein VEX15_04240 [Nocardioidaceae bacterium]|nr:hypothetical protein [Nocardioidaceae bacterium]
MTVKIRKAAKPICSQDYCDEDAMARGLCRKHYYRLWRRGLLKTRPYHWQDGSCSEPECDKPSYARGLCQPHYKRRWFVERESK